MKVQNKNDIGNPYHDEEGKFTSENNLGGSGENQNSSIEKIKGLILGENYSQNNEENYDFDDLDNFIDNLDLDDYFNELENQQKSNSEENNENLIKNEIENLEDSDYYEEILTYKDELDLQKISLLSFEEQKQIVNALQLLEKKNFDKEFLELEELDKKVFYHLFTSPIRPSDYLQKKDNLVVMHNFFVNNYKGENKQQKIDLLKEYEKIGQEYTERKENLDKKYKNAQDLVDKYANSNNPYSQKRKDEAIWIKDGFNAAKEKFASKYYEVREKLNKENPDYINSLINYTDASFDFINRSLRGLDYDASDEEGQEEARKFTQEVENITKAIDSSSYDYDIWLQRGTTRITDAKTGINISSHSSLEELKKFVGKTFKDQGFVSCGAGKDTGLNASVTMNIFAPKSTKMIYIAPDSYFDYENEMVIQRGYSYRIAKVEKKGNKVFLDCEVLLGTDSEKYDIEKLKEIQKNKLKT